MSSLYLLIALQLFFVHFFYVLSLVYRKGDLADLIWTFLICSWGIFFYYQNPNTVRSAVILVLILIWGLRLGALILLGRVLRSGEDSRYARFRRSWESQGQLKINFYLLFLSQLLTAAILAVPNIFIFQRESFSIADYLGFSLYFIGFQGVILADQQLAYFKSRPENKGQVCQFGLWSYSRHPNYFFENLIWCSYPCFAYGVSNGYLAFLSPILMFILLNFVTGIPPAEKQSLISKGDLYREYQKKTSKFFLWFPSK